MREEDAPVHMELRSFQPSPRRADEVAKSVDCAHGGIVERADERCAGQMCWMMFDISHTGPDDGLVKTDGRGDSAGQLPDAGQVSHAVGDGPLRTITKEEQPLAPQMRTGTTRDSE